MKMMKKRVKIGLAVQIGLLVFGAGCTRKQDTGKSVSAEDSILIGEVDSMSGANATYGISTHQGIELAIQEINASGGLNGKKLKLIALDDQDKPDESARGVSKLISHDHVAALISGVTSSNALAMAPIAQQNKIPLVITMATHPKVTQVGDYIFRICFIDSFQGKAMAKFALSSLKLRKVSVLTDVKSDYSVGLTEVFSEEFRKGGGEVLIAQSYSGGDIDFKSQLTSIQSRNPEAIYIPGFYSDAALIARQARELGMKQILLGADGWDSPKLKELGGAAFKQSYFTGFYFAEDDSPQVQKFFEQYKNKYHSQPDGSAVRGYEGMQVLFKALQSAKSLEAKEIQNALAQTKDLKVTTGKVSFDSNRNGVRPIVVLEVKEGGGMRYSATIDP
jgi:branched-chain amino acid transport system substrate-binding protein